MTAAAPRRAETRRARDAFETLLAEERQFCAPNARRQPGTLNAFARSTASRTASPISALA